jgi:hypothetical protein
MKCPLGFKNGIGFASVLLLLSLVLVLPALGANFYALVTPSLTSTTGVSHMVFNFTVNNMDAEKGIDQVVITLPSGFQFVPDNNFTSITPSLYVFTNETGNTMLVWNNSTLGDIIASGASEYFWFNSSVPSASGNYLFIVETTDNSNLVNSTNVSVVVDNAAPVVTLNTPNGVNLSSSNVTFKFNANDSVASSMNCSLYVDGVQKGFNDTTLNGTETSLPVSGLTSGQHSWNVNCTDGVGNIGASPAWSFGLYPNIVVSELSWLPQGDPHLNATSSIMVTAKVKNVGDFAITDLRKFNVTLKMDSGVKSYANLSTSMAAGNESIVFSSFLIQNIGIGNHTLLVEVINQDENGTFVINEANTSNNNNQINVYAGYLVTIESIEKYDSEINENETIRIKVLVKYSNGDPATNLVSSNFILTDNAHNPTEKTVSVNVISFDNTEAAVGRYKFNATTPNITNGRPEHGYHNITVVARMIMSDVMILEGTGTSAYTLYAPDVVISMSPPGDIDIGESQSFAITLTNNGNKNATGVSVKLFKVSGSGSVTWTKGPVNGDASGTTPFCGSSTPLDVSAGNTVACKNSASDDPAMKGKTAGEYRLGAWVNYTLNSSNYYYYLETGTNIINTTASQESGNENSAPPALGGDGAVCDSGKDCKSGYWCNNGMCRKLKQAVDIINFPERVEILAGQTGTFEVEVKNTGLTVTLMKLAVAADGIDVSIVPASKALVQAESFKFMVTLNAGSVDMGKYPGTITASVVTDAEVKSTKNFEVAILPTQEKKGEIDKLYANYSATFDDVSAEFGRFKALGFVTEENLSDVQGIFDAMKKSMDDAKDAFGKGDYLTGYISLKQFGKFYDQFNEKFDALQTFQTENMGTQWSSVWIWVIVSVFALGAGGFVTYKFILVEGYHPKLGFRPKRGLINQIKDSLIRRGEDKGIKTKVKMNFEPPAKKQDVTNSARGGQRKFSYSYKTAEDSILDSITDGVRGLFKKKKGKYLSDYV